MAPCAPVTLALALLYECLHLPVTVLGQLSAAKQEDHSTRGDFLNHMAQQERVLDGTLDLQFPTTPLPISTAVLSIQLIFSSQPILPKLLPKPTSTDFNK